MLERQSKLSSEVTIAPFASSGFSLPHAHAYLHELMVPLTDAEPTPYLRSRSLVIRTEGNHRSRPTEGMAQILLDKSHNATEREEKVAERLGYYRKALAAVTTWSTAVVSDTVRGCALLGSGGGFIQMIEGIAQAAGKPVPVSSRFRGIGVMGQTSDWLGRYQKIIKPAVFAVVSEKDLADAFALWIQMGAWQEQSTLLFQFNRAIEYGGRAQSEMFYRYIRSIVRLTKWETGD